MELLFNGFIGLILLVFFMESRKIEEVAVSSDKLGASGFPQIIIAISFILLIYITYKNIKNIKENKDEKTSKFKDKGFRTMLISIVLLAVYIFTMDIIGFILGTFIFSMLASRVMGYKDTMKTLIFSLVLTLGVTLIFGKVFYVSLPRGIGFIRELSYLIY